MAQDYGSILKEWRVRRRFSQLQLASELGVSSRHISFLETGRSSPSKEMVINLGSFLQVPQREINRMLVVSGHAPVFQNTMALGEGLVHVNYALDKLLEDHMPFPALVLSRDWDVVKANPAAVCLMQTIGFSGSDNLIECILAEEATRSCILNRGETLMLLLKRLRYEIDLLGGSERLSKLASDLAEHLKSCEPPLVVDYSQHTMNTQFRVNDRVLSYFSLVTQMGSVLDVTASEFKVELMFPADDTTRGYHTEQFPV